MSPGCCSWICCRSSSPEPEPEFDNGTTRIVRKTTKNGTTITTTTTTTYTNHNSALARGQIDMESSSFMPSEPEDLNDLNEIQKSNFKNKKTPSTGHQFEVECLNEHNRLRALHGCPPLKINRNLCVIAKNWAINMANSNNMKHSKGKYGENLFMCSGYFIDGRQAVESWYNEIKHYSFRKPSFSLKTGHFTQVVWKDSKELGVGVEVRGNTTWVVANYNPPGNVASLYEQNVPRLLRQ